MLIELVLGAALLTADEPVESPDNEAKPAATADASADEAKPSASEVKPQADKAETAEEAKPSVTKKDGEKEKNGEKDKEKDKKPDDPTTGIESRYPVDSDEWLTADPLLIIDTEMNSVVNDMRDDDLFRPHSSTQPRIIARFDKLIERLERKKTGSGGGSNPTMPASVSGLGGGPDQAGDLRAADDETGAMEKISGAQRKKIQQATADGFPAGFDDVLSDYYRRLAETKAAE